MKHQEIMELIDHFAGSGLQSMKLAQEGVSLEIHRGTAAAKPEVRSAEIMPVPEEAPEAVDAITAPLAGIFYAAPAPDQPPFVTAGARVKKGQTVCLLEAMKMMSEIPAPCDCVIDEVLKTNGELAAFGEPLFQYRPC